MHVRGSLLIYIIAAAALQFDTAQASCSSASCSSAVSGAVLDEYSFVHATDGWTTSAAACQERSNNIVDFRLATTGFGVQGADNGHCAWYFEGPTNCLQDKSAAYHGSLQLELSHAEFNDGGVGVDPTAWDVLLWGDDHRVRLGLKGLFSGYSSASSITGTYTVLLNSSSAWMNTETNVIATDAQILQALTKVSRIAIRGGWYPGPETTVLRKVVFYDNTVTSEMDKEAAASQTATSDDTGCKPKCRGGRRHTVVTENVVQTATSGTLATIQFTNVPQACTQGVLELTVQGALYAADSFLEVTAEDGESLGYIFNQEFPQDNSNQGVTDTLVPGISKSRMVRYTIDRTVVFMLSVPSSSRLDASSISVVRGMLSFSSAACYRQVVDTKMVTTTSSLSFSFSDVYTAVSTAAFVLTVTNADEANTPDSVSATNAFVVEASGLGAQVINERTTGKINTAQFVGLVTPAALNQQAGASSNSINGTLSLEIGTMSSLGFSATLELIYAPEECFVMSVLVDRGTNLFVPDGSFRDEFGATLRADYGDTPYAPLNLLMDGFMQSDLTYNFADGQSTLRPAGDALVVASGYWETATEDRSAGVHTATEMTAVPGQNPTKGPSLASIFARTGYSSSQSLCVGGQACPYASTPSYKYPVVDSAFVSKASIDAASGPGTLLMTLSHNPGFINVFYVTLSFATKPSSAAATA